jgi:predicted pyridoxine 5'-phosphate oxidase superfamily flavin-nucleotide-binding protein
MKYIQRRHIVNRQASNNSNLDRVRVGSTLDESQQEVIRRSDTFFIGSANPKGYLDASHRGGNPGFVELVDDKTIRIPDYKGNSMFNTFGNLMLNENAGVVFWDFEQGKILQMTGKVKIYWDNPGTEQVTTGTKRFWEFTLEKWVEQKIGRNFKWEFLDYSPHNAAIKN